MPYEKMNGVFGMLFKQKQKVITLNGKNYEITSKIAEGGFGFVYLVKDEQQREYALKQLLFNTLGEQKVFFLISFNKFPFFFFQTIILFV